MHNSTTLPTDSNKNHTESICTASQQQTQRYIKYLQTVLKQRGIDYQTHEQYASQTNKIQSNIDLRNNKHEEKQQQTQKLNQQYLLKTNLTEQLNGQLVHRYSRQMLLKQIGYQGQLKIVKAKVGIIGAGGIGCPLAMYLAAAGIGTIGLFDSDSVQISNLHRQIGHRTQTIAIAKTKSLSKTLLSLNPNIVIVQHPFITVQSAHLMDNYDLIIDGSDNPQCRYIVNDYMMAKGRRLLSGACVGWEGQVTCYGNHIIQYSNSNNKGESNTSNNGDSITQDKTNNQQSNVVANNPCYRCIWGDDQVSMGGCSTLGVIGMLPGIVGMILATEAIKIIVNGKSSLQGQLLTYQARTCTFRKLKLRNKKPQCQACGQNRLKMQQYPYSKYQTCSTPSSNPLPQIPQISWQKYLAHTNNNTHKSQSNNAQIHMDVRPRAQFDIVYFINSINVPYQQLIKMDDQKLKNLVSNREIFVSCKMGVMSKKATNYLQQKGYKNATNIQGGINAYAKIYDHNIPNI